MTQVKEHPNFYEDIAEAVKRISGTVVKYDDDFYYVLLVSNHKTDGIFRVYLDPLKHMDSHNIPGIPYLGAGSESGKAMDIWMEANPKTKIIRKMMNSPLFDKFRPFPLGMTNYDGSAYFTERSPTRHTQQGLTSQMISAMSVDFNSKGRVSSELTSTYMYDTYLGVYPSYTDCVSNMFDPDCHNRSVGFCRLMALVRGPCETVFLNYRGETIGQLLDPQGKSIRIGRKFLFTKEIVQSSGYFETVVTE